MTKNVLEMTVEIVAAHVARNDMDAKDVPGFVKDLHGTLADLKGGEGSTAPAPKAAPAPAKPTESKKAKPAEDAEKAPPEAPAEEAPQEETSNLVALPRHNDLSAPEFKGLDPWLADRLAPKTAAKLDASNDIHPSVFPNHIICLENGAEVKLLKSYLRKNFDGMTPEQYIEKWNLPDDYPMAPPEYIKNKRELAKKSGLGSSIRARGKKGKTTRTSTAKPATTAKTAGKGATAKSPAKVGTRRKQPLIQGKEKAAN